MPTAKATSHTTAQALFSTPEHVVGKITAINIDNQSGGNRTLRIQDEFTPDPSVGTPSPVPETKERFQITVSAGQSVSVDKNSLENIRILGDCKSIGDDIQALCVIVVNYHFE